MLNFQPEFSISPNVESVLTDIWIACYEHHFASDEEFLKLFSEIIPRESRRKCVSDKITPYGWKDVCKLKISFEIKLRNWLIY
jgi:hypothetical protein